MMMRTRIKSGRFYPKRSLSNSQGFTLMEVILVLVILVVIASISIPYMAGSMRGSKLRTSARTIGKMARYARSMAIMREEPYAIVLDHEKMKLYLGPFKTQQQNSTADGEIDQQALKNLGYVDDDSSALSPADIQVEAQKLFPEHVVIKDFNKDRTTDDDEHPDLHVVRFFPNGQCEWFELELEDSRGSSVRMELDPITAKISSEFIQ